MDINITIISGRIAAEPEVTYHASGTTSVDILVTNRSAKPRRRIDVLPVTMWDPSEELIDDLRDSRGMGVLVTGSVQRRFWSAIAGRNSRVVIVADSIELDA